MLLAGAPRTSCPPGRERGASACKGKIKPSHGGGGGETAPRGAAGQLVKHQLGRRRVTALLLQAGLFLFGCWAQTGRHIRSGTVLLPPGCLLPSGSGRAPRHGQLEGVIGRVRSVRGLFSKHSPSQLLSCLLFQDKGC